MESTQNLIWYACDEHLEYIMDDLIEQFHTAPTLEPLIEVTHAHVCQWCGELASYQLELEYGVSE